MLTNNSHRNLAWLLFLVIAGGYLLLAVQFPRVYILATYEDLFGEWAQVYLFLLVLILALRQVFVLKRFKLFFGLLALASFYVVGEEISWGQRLFAISTPEFFDQHNLQGETNLHNFFTGPISTLTKQLIEYALAAGLAGYGLVYPWLLQRRISAALWLESKGLAAPPLYLWPFFVLSGVLELGLFQFNEAEIAEILIPFALGIMTLNYCLANHLQIDLRPVMEWSVAASRQLALMTCLLLVSVAGLAFGTTVICYDSPRLGPELVDRYYSGVEKFAGRYKRYGQWQLATDLYLEVQQDQPGRASLRRNLFRCYQQLGQPQLAQQHLDKAIEIDRQRLEKRPGSIAAHISLVRNYQLLDQRQKMQQHLQYAITIGETKKAADAQNPATAYWLGRSYELRGDYVKARSEFARAVELRPESLRYRKALLATTSLLRENQIAAL